MPEIGRSGLGGERRRNPFSIHIPKARREKDQRRAAERRAHSAPYAKPKGTTFNGVLRSHAPYPRGVLQPYRVPAVGLGRSPVRGETLPVAQPLTLSAIGNNSPGEDP